MQTPEEIRETLHNLPLDAKLDALAMLQADIASEHQKLADKQLADDLAVCQERLDRYERGEMPAHPWDKVMSRVFGD